MHKAYIRFAEKMRFAFQRNNTLQKYGIIIN